MTRSAARKKPGARRAPRRPVSPEILAAVKADARAFFRDARGSHDWDHTERVYRLCERIGRKEGADQGVLRLAALLHDIGRDQEDRSSGKICHSRAGAALAKNILESHGLDPDTIRDIVHCVRTHRFRKRAVPKTLEAKVLFDADKLDSIGAVGISRAFLFAGEVGARLHDKDLEIHKTKPYTREDTAYREYLVKLARVKGRVFTREGKRIAAERHRYMAGFFNRLNKEMDGIL
jgi:uncharacterized protein